MFIKAAAGGGGRGMKVVYDHGDLRAAFDTLSAEVRTAFGDGTLYLERYIPNARHIEVQIVGDHFGNIIHLGERDCSIQRHYQKIIEEAPSPVVSEELRKKICQAAVKIAKKIKYRSAGTVEFLLDQDNGQFYFLEMNTRIQVEHPITEEITGVDLVQEQIRIAELQPLRYSQTDINLNGNAIECRINAESPFKGFEPCPGRIEIWAPPEGLGIRVDSHCYTGYSIPVYYDSLLAKVIASGASRLQAIERMRRALDQFIISGVDTTISFHQLMLKHPDFMNGRINTKWVEETVLNKLKESP